MKVSGNEKMLCRVVENKEFAVDVISAEEN